MRQDGEKGDVGGRHVGNTGQPVDVGILKLLGQELA